ncbi:MAG TPA: ATP-binding protein [Gemmatimonadaceae bacterium]|nr:ATP-binding protein [Gemmatimonadaceae bacterium]
MASTRVRFTVSYVALAMGAVTVFAIALYNARKAVAREQLYSQAIFFADDIVRDIQLARQRGYPLMVADTADPGSLSISPQLRQFLELRPGYFILMQDTVNLYNSPQVRALPRTDGDSLLQYTRRVSTQVQAFVPLVADSLNEHKLFIIARRAGPGLEPTISQVIVGIPDQYAELSGQLLLGTIFVLLPFVLIACALAAWFMADRAFAPMHELTEQLEAITDGRSLHRRLPPDIENDELGRLTTTLNAMLSRLELSFAALRRFTADASHELKTPLAVLRADVERAMHPRTTREDRMVALEESLQEVTRMSDLVDSLLTLARADEGRFELAREEVHIEPLLRDVYETATILGESAGLSISMPAITDAVVHGERIRLRQLLLNLVTNAIKYTPRGGKVEISSVLRTPTEVAITVRDTGIGISATDLPHIFDRFWRADRARSRAAERSGFGLGLAISQYIAHAHGGTLIAQSRLGRGTVFTVLLPVEATSPALMTPRRPAAAGSGALAARPDANSDFTDS